MKGLIENLEYTQIVRYGRYVIAADLYGPLTIMTYRFKGTPCSLGKADFFNHKGEAIQLFKAGGCWS